MALSSRRDFLKIGTASVALAVGGSALWWGSRSMLAPNLREYLMLCDTTKDVPVDKNPVRVTNPGWVRALDVQSGESFSIDLPFFGHTVDGNPAKPGHVVTFEKWGKRAALIDMKQRSVLSQFSSSDNSLFFGHGAFTPDGSTLITTEDTYDRNGGVLVFRDAKTLKVLDQVQSGGTRPHECRLINDGKTLLVTNQGNDLSLPSIVWLDTATGDLKQKVTFDEKVPGNYPVQLYGGFGHLDASYDNWVCASSVVSTGTKETRDDPSFKEELYGALVFVSPEGKAYYPDLPLDLTKRMRGEALSVAILGKSGLMAVTFPAANMILVFEYKTQRLVQVIDTPRPTGVIMSLSPKDNDHTMLVENAKDKSLLSIVATEGGSPKTDVVTKTFGGNGSHMHRIYM